MSSPAAVSSIPGSAPRITLHGTPLRGLMSTVRSQNFQGKFGRLFRHAPIARYGPNDAASKGALTVLGAKMSAGFDGPKNGPDPEESGIPALYTYFGQFIDHDVTFDPNSTLVQRSDPAAITDYRSPALDLDNVYGRGPNDQPYMYDPSGKKFLLGNALANGAPDLPRNAQFPARAIIGDPRNDENSIVSQLQGLFLRFHNRTVDDNKNLSFDQVQDQVRFHYQWIVLYDFLPRIIQSSVLDKLKTDGKFDRAKLKFFTWKNDCFIPVEFSVAAYRFGHSMVRPGYRLNNDPLSLLPIFPVPAQGFPTGLTGFQALDANHFLDWGRFIDLDVRPYGDLIKDVPANQSRLQLAYRIDTSLVNPLAGLPAAVASDAPPSLAARNLIRGFDLELPNGQSVAKAMGVSPLLDKQITIGKAVDPDQIGQGDVLGSIDKIPELAMFKGNCPLWTYILAEAMLNKEKVTAPTEEKTAITTPKLGQVGGRIVAETLVGLIMGDHNSYLNVDPAWQPASGAQYALKDFVKYALGQ